MARNDLPEECCGCKQHLTSLGVCAEHTSRGFDLQDSVVQGRVLPVWCYKRKAPAGDEPVGASDLQQAGTLATTPWTSGT